MQDTITKDKTDDILRKVRALLAIADDERAPDGERDAARQRAEALMFKYRIEEATAVSQGYSGEDGGLRPVWRTIVLTKASSEFEHHYRMLAATVSQHVGSRYVLKYVYGQNDTELIAEFCGYESDLRYGDVLLTSMLLEFGKRLEPKHDPNLSFDENAYHMRMAGMERKRITRILLGDWATENEMKAKNRKVTAAVKRECERRGEDPNIVLGRGNNMKTFRDSYAEGFVNQMWTRLSRMREAHGAETGAVVLRSRKEYVDEAFYEKYPDRRPKPADPTDAHHKSEPCRKCERAKSGHCRDHRPLRYVERAWNPNAAARGRQAALNVDLGPNATGTSRMRPTDERKGLN
jgi:hypothetical protein